MSRVMAERNDSPTQMSLRSSRLGPEKLLISTWRMSSAMVCGGGRVSHKQVECMDECVGSMCIRTGSRYWKDSPKASANSASTSSTGL